MEDPFDTEVEEHELTPYDLLEDTSLDHIEQNTEFRNERQIWAMIDKVKFFHLAMDEDPIKWADPEQENYKYMRSMISFRRKGRAETVEVGNSTDNPSLMDRLL